VHRLHPEYSQSCVEYNIHDLEESSATNNFSRLPVSNCPINTGSFQGAVRSRQKYAGSMNDQSMSLPANPGAEWQTSAVCAGAVMDQPGVSHPIDLTLLGPSHDLAQMTTSLVPGPLSAVPRPFLVSTFLLPRGSGLGTPCD
jgi:hypothetical protein